MQFRMKKLQTSAAGRIYDVRSRRNFNDGRLAALCMKCRVSQSSKMFHDFENTSRKHNPIADIRSIARTETDVRTLTELNGDQLELQLTCYILFV